MAVLKENDISAAINPLIKTIQAMSQEIAQIVIDKNLFKAELEQAREEIVKLQQQLEE